MNRNHEGAILFVFLLVIVVMVASMIAVYLDPLLNDVAKLIAT